MTCEHCDDTGETWYCVIYGDCDDEGGCAMYCPCPIGVALAEKELAEAKARQALRLAEKKRRTQPSMGQWEAPLRMERTAKALGASPADIDRLRSYIFPGS